MFAIWVLTLHLPRTLLGLYGGGGLHNPDEWSSLFIAMALWGGPWTAYEAGPWGHPGYEPAPPANSRTRSPTKALASPKSIRVLFR